MWMSLYMAIAGVGLPYWVPPSLPPRERGDTGFALQPFGMIVAAGVLIGASIMRRFSERHGVDDDDLRGLTGWIIATGFIGAHVFDVLVYEPHKLTEQGPIILLKLWDGISSYGGFVGGAMGYLFFVWWKRLQWALMADICIVGLLPAFSIGRIGCTVVHDHPGSPTSFALGFDYPASFVNNLDPTITTGMRLHNLGMYELAYLIPINLLVLWLGVQEEAAPAGRRDRGAGRRAVRAGPLLPRLPALGQDRSALRRLHVRAVVLDRGGRGVRDRGVPAVQERPGRAAGRRARRQAGRQARGSRRGAGPRAA
jgi:hypothetical protein